MKKKIYLKKLIPLLVITAFCYFGFKEFITTDSLKNNTSKKRDAFNNYLDKHPFNNRDLSFEDLEKLPKKDRPDLAAEQNYLMLIDPNTLTVPYQKIVTAFDFTQKKLTQKAQYQNKIQQKNNLNSLEFLDDTFFNEALTVGGNPVVWKERGPDNIGGRTRALLWDPNDSNNKRVFAAGVTGGIWVNDNVLDSNSSWRAVNDFLSSIAVNTLTADPTDSQVFYAGTGEGWFNSSSVRGIGVFKSVDAGKTWSLLPSTTGSDFAYVQKLEITPSGTIIIATRATNATDGGIFRSTDDGVTFTRVLNSRGADIEIATNGDIYASRGIFSTGTIFKSVNDGVDWTDVTPPGGNSPGRIEIAVAPSNTNIVYAMAHDRTDNTIDWVQKSTDAGATWTNLTIPQHNDGCDPTLTDITRNQAWYDLILAVSPTNPDVVIAGGVDLARTDDGGQSWTQISEWTNCSSIENVHADHHNIVFRPGHPNEAIFGTDGGIYYSPNASIAKNPTFETRDKNFTTTQFYSVATDNIANSDYYIGGAQDNGSIQLRSDLNFSGVEVFGGDGAFTHVDQTDRTYQLTSSQNGRSAHSTNGGASFRRLQTLGTGNFINQSDYDNSTGILYSTAANDEIAIITGLKTTTPSAERAISIDIGGRQISAIRANANTPNRIFIGTEGGRIYRIDDANETTPIVTEITSNITSVGNVSSIDIGSSDLELIATLSNFGVISVWYSLDGGSSWISKDEFSYGLPDIPIRWALFNPNNTKQVLLATELGVWSTNDITAINPGWEPSNEGLANVRCDMIQYRPADGMIVVATHGRGFFTSNIFANDDTAAPTIVSLNPTDNSTLVSPLDLNLELQFNEPIQKATGTIKVFATVDDSLIENIDVTSSQVNVSGSRAIINLSNNLVASTGYYVQIDAGTFKDNFNNTFIGIIDKTTWNFTMFDGDESPIVLVPISDISVNENAPNKIIDLSTTFNDPDNDNNQITYNIINNSNTAVVNTALVGNNLTLSFPANKIGSSEIIVRATSNGKTVDDIFNVVVNSTATTIFAQSNRDVGSGLLEGNYLNTTNRNVDDFIIPGGQSWEISTLTTQAFSLGQAALNLQSVNVVVYNDDNSSPGAILQQQTILAGQGQIIGGTQANTSLTVRLNNTISLTSGTYWVSIHPSFNVNMGQDSNTALYAWFRSSALGNSYSEDSPGVFSADNRELLFTINGTLEITDAAPTVANPISDINISELPNPNPLVLDLSSTFTDLDNDDNLITITVVENTNASVVTPTINGKQLFLDFSGSFGATKITVRATSNGLTVDESFNVELLSTLYNQSANAVGTTPSQIFTDFSNASLESADDFEIPNNETWDIFQISVIGSNSNNAPQSAVVKIYNDDNGLPGSEIFNSGSLIPKPTNANSSDFNLTFNSALSLSSGIYWVSVQVELAFNSPANNQWFWRFSQPAIANDYARKDPNNLLQNSWTANWQNSSNNGALLFTLYGESKNVLNTSNFNSNELVVLQNPTDGLFKVKLGSSFNSALNIDIYDVRGRLVLKKSISDFSQPNFYVDLRNETSGIYIMRIVSDNKSKSFKLIKT